MKAESHRGNYIQFVLIQISLDFKIRFTL